MATLTLGASFQDVWFPEALAGGTIAGRFAGRMTYLSDAGYTVTLRGTGLTYDDDGLPASGRVTGIEIARDGITYAIFTDISLDFGQAGMLAFGFDRHGWHQSPQPYSLWWGALRDNDTIFGSDSADDLRGGEGKDLVFAGGGDDYLEDERGADTLDGGQGDWDSLAFYSANTDALAYRGVFVDTASGIAVDNWGDTNQISGFESFRDSLFSDTLFGSDGGENFWLSRGNDFVDGRGGWDSVDYADASDWGAHRGIRANLATGIIIDPWRGKDTVTGIEEMAGSIFNDTMIGSARDDQFSGNQGIDAISGGDGFDQVAFWGAATGIVINTAMAAQVRNDGFGNVETTSGIESYIGSALNDLILGGSAADHFSGWYGADTLAGGGGADFLGGGQGDDRLTGNAGADRFEFRGELDLAGIDIITDMQAGIDRIWIESAWGGLSAEALTANQFRAGAGVTSANSASQRLIYDTTTGALFFDADGNGGNFTAQRIATLANHASLAFTDFAVFL